MAKNKIIITGLVTDQNKKPIANLRIEAWDKDLIVDDFVGEAISDSNGGFQIGFTQNRFKELFFDRRPDIYFKIYLGTELVLSTEDIVCWNVENSPNKIEIMVPMQSENKGDGNFNSITFRGLAKHSSGNPIEKVKVLLSEKMLRGEKQIAETITDASGNYSITINVESQKSGYLLKVVDKRGKALLTSDVIFAEKALVTQDFVIDDKQFKGTPAFAKRIPELKKYVDELNNNSEKKPLSVEDVNFIAKQSNLEPRDTFHWIRANELGTETSIPAEAFYGMFKQGLPTNLKNLSSRGGTELVEAIKKAADANQISDEVAAMAQDMVDNWNSYMVEKALDEVPKKMNASLGQILGFAVKDKTTQKKVLKAYLENTGTIGEFYAELPKLTGDEQGATKIQNVLKLASLTGNQTDVISALISRNYRSENIFHELAAMDKDDMMDFINDLSNQKKKSVVPEFIVADKESTRVSMYAENMSKILEQNFPTQSFFGKLANPKNQNSPFNAKADLLKFIENNPSFDLKSTSTIALLSEDSGLDFEGIDDKNLVASEIQSIQRLTSYSTDFKIISVLKGDGLDSAYNIVSMPENKFVETYGLQLGDVQTTQMIYKQAEKSYMQSAMIWAQTHNSLSFGTTTTPSPISDPTLRTLFGTLDACECQHCISVFSPAAYFTDILNFLYSRTPDVYNELIRRRPDLVHIDLTCENTNMPLPYVDLVNELLENYILVNKIAPVAVPDSYQTTWQAKELAANPEHINYDAYDELKTAVYPQGLPFNLPVEEARVYLKHLGVQKAALMTTFYAGSQADAFDDFNVNMERLNFNPQEAKILSGETTGDGSSNSGLWNFYGFDRAIGYKALVDPADSSLQISGGNWNVALNGRVDVFLQQTNLIYKELLTLLLCDTINPVTGTDGSGNSIRAISIVSIDGDNASCELDNLKLSGVTEGHLTKIHRFLRLWRKLGWSMFDIDRACVAFGLGFGSNVSTNKAKLSKLSQMHFLSKRLKLSIESVLAFWSDISITSYTDYSKDNYPPVASLYEKLFSNKAVLNPIDPAFQDPQGLAGVLDDHVATIVSALQIGEEEYGYLKDELPDNNLTLDNLSRLYRNTILSKKLKLSIENFLTLREIIGTSVFNSPLDTFSFLSNFDIIKTSGFSIDQINYLFNHDYLEETGIAPDDTDISVFLSELRSALRAIENSSADDQRNTIVQKFSERLKISATTSGLLMQSYVKGITDPTQMVVEDFRADDYSTFNFLKTFTDTSDPLNPQDFEPIFVRSNPEGDVTMDEQPNLFNNFMRLDKIATVINKLKLSDTDLENILSHHSTMLCSNLATLPIVATSSNFSQFQALVKLIKARDAMPLGTPDFFEIVLNAITSPDKGVWLDNLSIRTNWDRAELEALVGDSATLSNAGILNTNFPSSFVNGDLILLVKDCLKTIERIGLNTTLIETAIAEDFTSIVSNDIKNAAKAKYDEAQWLKLAKPLRDELREKQREALVSFVLARPSSLAANDQWKNTDEMYEHFLIDVEMKPISMTSRIKQAICTVQLFIDRVLMNLEHPNSDPSVSALKLEGDQVEEWKEWRKIYRIWEANRKIFLYPENWIEPELRDDKSPFFKDLETMLKQNELNEDNVEDAFHFYLNQLDEVARLEVVGMYHQQETFLGDEDDIDILHVFARSSSNPHRYYHRTLEDSEWTPWLKLEIDVDGDHVVPIIFNRKLCLFWLFFIPESEESEDISDEAPQYWKIHAAWSEFRKNKWTAKKLSKKFLTSGSVESKSDLESIKSSSWAEPNVINDKLHLDVLTGAYLGVGAFLFNNTTEEPHLGDTIILPYWGKYEERVVFEHVDQENEMMVSQDINGPLSIWHYNYEINPYYQSSSVQIEILERGNDDKFKLVRQNRYADDMPKSFFLQDKDHTFYVTHSLVSVPTFTKPDYGLADWNDDILINWGDLYRPFPDPEDPIFNTGGGFTDPIQDIDEYFNTELLEVAGTLQAQRKPQTIELKNATVFMHGSDKTMNVESRDEIVMQPMMLRGASQGAKKAGISSNTNADLIGKTSSIGLISTGNILVTKYKSEHRFTFNTFYHAHVKTFIKELYKLGVEGMLTRDIQTQADTILFDASYNPTGLVKTPYPISNVDFSYGSPYSQYNWELFFHVPMLIACRLKDDQRFEEARDWFHYIFDPTQSEGGDKERFWKFKPFYDEAGTTIETLDDLLNNTAELQEQVDKWMDNPFMPHVIARMRISAYMKNVVMKYLDNLIAWGDNLFRRDTIEAINEATNLYILASKILGERPQDIPPRAKSDEVTFDEIKDDLDPFSNALVNIETMLSPSLSGSGVSSGSSNALGEMFYFCVPRNEFLMKYWDTVADRLFKIRNSMNIQGIVRMLPLFEPPIDPAMLVRAAAAGMDLSSILSDMNAPLPKYRFNFMLQKAIEFSNEVKGLGGALLQALEKRDAEAFALLRSAQEQKLLDAVLSLKEKMVDDAKEQVESVKKSKEIIQIKHNYYSSRELMNSFEKQQLNSIQIGMVFSMIQGELNTIGGMLSAIPNLKIGAPTSMGATWGGDNMGAMMNAISTYMGIFAAINNAQGSMAGTLGSYNRRMDDWNFQASSAEKELEQIEKQIISSEIKLAIAEKDLLNHQLQIENNVESDEFMRSKFTNQQLYDWMIGQLSTVYFQSYQLAFDLAKKAEQCYQYELGEYGNSSFIQFGYWDSLKKGLLSAEKLQFDLRRMESSYYDLNDREFELTKHISLLLLNPQAILDLRNTGTCDFTIPEAMYDLDFPGHFFRRIKSVSVSIPCIAGPYTSINATLRLLTHTTRLNASGASYDSADFASDDRFRHITTETHSIATSTGQNDSGMFELNFRDERYLPFEGCGVFGKWQLELNTREELRMFDYNTISDVIVSIRYSAQEDVILKNTVNDYLVGLIEGTIAPTDSASGMDLNRMFSLRHEFSTEWHKLFHPLSGSAQLMNFTIVQEQLPFFVQNREIAINKVHVYGSFDNNTEDYDVVITSNGGSSVTFALTPGASYHAVNPLSLPAGFGLGDFTLTVKKAGVDAPESEVKDIVVVLDYQCV